MRTSLSVRVSLAIELAIVALTVAAFWIGSGIGDGLLGGAVVLAFVVALELGRRRSGTLAVMSGLGDERERDLYQRAVAFSGSVLSFVLPGWALVTAAQGEMDATAGILCVVFAVSFLFAVVVLSRRS